MPFVFVEPTDHTLQWISGPSPELLLLSEAKDHLRLTADVEIQSIQVVVQAARESLENELGKPLGEQVFEQKLLKWPSSGKIELARFPFNELLRITYQPDGASEIVFFDSESSPPIDPGTFTVQGGGDFEPAFIQLNTDSDWPTEDLAPGWPIAIRFKSGLTTLPPVLRWAWLLTIHDMWENRGAVAAELPIAVKRLCNKWRDAALS